MKVKRSSQGFSLIELIVVIAVMAVLLGILAPQYLKYIEKARESKCMTNQDTLLGACLTVDTDAVVDNRSIGFEELVTDSLAIVGSDAQMDGAVAGSAASGEVITLKDFCPGGGNILLTLKDTKLTSHAASMAVRSRCREIRFMNRCNPFWKHKKITPAFIFPTTGLSRGAAARPSIRKA